MDFQEPEQLPEPHRDGKNVKNVNYHNKWCTDYSETDLEEEIKREKPLPV